MNGERRPGIAIAALALALFAGCDGNPETRGATPPAAPAAAERAAVRTLTLEPGPFEDRLEVTASLEPWRESALASDSGGLVRDVRFDKGDRVREGDVLASLGDDLVAVRLEQARAELAAAEAEAEKARKLAEREALPRVDAVTATARRDLQAARVREMELKLERAVVRAPFDGVVTARHVERGEVALPGARVATIQQIDRLKVRAAVPDTEIRWLRTGRQAKVTVDAWRGREFDARVRYIAPAADPGARSFEVELELPNPDLALRPGMVARVTLSRRTVQDGIAVPLDALVTRVEGRVAFVVRDCRAELREVETAAVQGDRALVASGLEAGDVLVVDGQRELADGQPIRSEGCP